MRANRSKKPKLPGEILEHYGSAQERLRLGTHTGQLEYCRTQEILTRFIPNKPTVILDIGGGPGRYACWLARLGHVVHLIDPVPLHIEQAKRASNSQPGKPLASVTRGDARNLGFADKSAGAVLLLGPLYHLVKKDDRIRSLSAAFRTLKPGGFLFAAGISRFASALDGLFRNFVKDPRFFRIVQRDLRNGQHRNFTAQPEYFTTAFFHHPDELEREMQEAGFEKPQLYAIEGPGWLVPDFKNYWSHPRLRARLLTIIRSVETEPALMGQSAHILGMARKKL
jgi:ubiquinone/menaquinone biosynthesis C-methylase UbiE